MIQGNRVPWLARGTGKPGREPDEPRKTDDQAHGAQQVDGGGEPPRGPRPVDVTRHERFPPRPDRRGATRSPGKRPSHPTRSDRHRPARPAFGSDDAASSVRPALPDDPASLPPLPPAFREVLADGLETLDLALPDAAADTLECFVRLLLAWNRAINLTAIRDPVAAAREHILDSLSAVPLLRTAGARRIVDLGSGGGVPGIPVAVALEESRVTLVESIGKKARFLRTATGTLGLDSRVRVAAERAEALTAPGREREQYDAVLVRAVGPLVEIAELGLPLLAVGGRLVAWKRGSLDTELAAAGPLLHHLGGGPPRVHPVAVSGIEDHRLVVIDKIGTTPAVYPRLPAERRRDRA